MTQSQSKKDLYQLMEASMAIQSLDAEKKARTQDLLLNLPEAQMQKIIAILRDEQRALELLRKKNTLEKKLASKVYGMAESLRDAGRRLDKAFLITRESKEREEESQATYKLLDEIDRL
jgi:hypothetical protein